MMWVGLTYLICSEILVIISNLEVPAEESHESVGVDVFDYPRLEGIVVDNADMRTMRQDSACISRTHSLNRAPVSEVR